MTRADKFDRLISEPGWLEIQNFFADQINAAILKAAADNPLEAEQQRLHVIQWNAKRELNDAALHYIQQTRRQRDEILSSKRAEENYGYSSSYDRPI